MSVFTKAANKKASTKTATKTKKAGTTWGVGSPDDDKIAKSLHQLSILAAEKKTIDAKMKVHKTAVLVYAKENFYEDYAANGIFPETPMKVTNSDGEGVSFVVQERTQYAVKDDSLDALNQLLGADGTEELIYEETVFGFDRDILSKDGVMDVLGTHIEAAMEELVATGVLDEDTAGCLLDAEIKRSYRPGVLQRLALSCGRSAGKIRQVCEAMGSSVVQYVKC